jgi:hypothetical protein
MRLIVPAVLLLSACAREQPVRVDRSPLVGTWRASAYIVTRSGEAPRYPFGDAPKAYLVYDNTGHVFFQAVADARVLEDARGRWRGADSAALTALLQSGLAYFGTYTANAGAGTVTHHIEGELPPNIGTTEVATPYRVAGDTLVLGVDSLTHWRFTRVR